MRSTRKVVRRETVSRGTSLRHDRTYQVTTHRVPCERISHPKRLVQVELHVANPSSEGRRDCSKLSGRQKLAPNRGVCKTLLRRRVCARVPRAAESVPPADEPPRETHNITKMLYVWPPTAVGGCRTRYGHAATPQRLSLSDRVVSSRRAPRGPSVRTQLPG